MVKAIVLKSLCEDILKGDEVEIVPDYLYMMGTNERIKDYFKVEPGEVVVKKTINSSERKSSISITKCNKKDIKTLQE